MDRNLSTIPINLCRGPNAEPWVVSIQNMSVTSTTIVFVFPPGNPMKGIAFRHPPFCDVSGTQIEGNSIGAKSGFWSIWMFSEVSVGKIHPVRTR